MIFNLLVIGFVIGMAVAWASYGLFSSFMHLIITIIAGTLAFALWEVWVYHLLIGLMPSFAWGLGLLLPFIVILIALRQVGDKLVKGNVKYPRLVSQIVGGACGAASGVITAGFAVIGLGFMPLPVAIAGFQPYEVQSGGTVEPREGGKLWLPVDELAGNFFSSLSVGAFSAKAPLAVVYPELPKQAASFRLAHAEYYDPFQNLSASPDTVGVTKATKLPGGTVEFFNGSIDTGMADANMLLVNTRWEKIDGTATYDSDDILRVPPTQVRLLVTTANGGRQLMAPLGFAKPNGSGDQIFRPIGSNNLMASSTYPSEQISWLFALPKGVQPQYLLARNLRLKLPKIDEVELGAMTIALGSLPEYDEDGKEIKVRNQSTNPSGSLVIDGEPSGYATHRAVLIEQNNKLPKVVSKNDVGGAFRGSGEAIESGSGLTGTSTGGRGNAYNSVYVPESLRGVRLKIEDFTFNNAFSNLAKGGQVSNIQQIWLSNTRGDAIPPFGYALLNSDRSMRIVVDQDAIRETADLRLNEFDQDAGEEFYLYFRLPPGSTITGYHIGSQAVQEFVFDVK